MEVEKVEVEKVEMEKVEMEKVEVEKVEVEKVEVEKVEVEKVAQNTEHVGTVFPLGLARINGANICWLKTPNMLAPFSQAFIMGNDIINLVVGSLLRINFKLVSNSFFTSLSLWCNRSLLRV